MKPSDFSSKGSSTGLLGGKGPPKFAPKVPTIKKEKVAEKEPDNVHSSNGKGNHKEGSDRFRKGNVSNFGRGRAREDDRTVVGGRGRWTMPTGQAFFTATNSSIDSIKSQESSAVEVEGKPVIIKSEFAPKAFKISRPNEDIFDSLNGAKSNSNISRTANEPAPYVFVKDESEPDSDEEDTRHGKPSGDDSEVWPPKEYDPLAPMELPFGPRTRQTRALLAEEAILANPHDREALEREESNTLFLFQMPSELRFEKFIVPKKDANGIEDSGHSNNDSEKIRLDDRKLGKLQLLKSGKVRLVTSWGRTFELHPGLAVSFAQYLASISLEAPAPSSASSSSAMSSDAPSSSSASMSQQPLQHSQQHQGSHVGTGMLNRGAQNISGSYSTGSSSSSGGGTARVNGSGQSGSGAVAASADGGTKALEGDIHFLGFVTKKIILTSHYQLDAPAVKIEADTDRPRGSRGSYSNSSSLHSQRGVSSNGEVVVSNSSVSYRSGGDGDSSGRSAWMQDEAVEEASTLRRANIVRGGRGMDAVGPGLGPGRGRGSARGPGSASRILGRGAVASQGKS